MGWISHKKKPDMLVIAYDGPLSYVHIPFGGLFELQAIEARCAFSRCGLKFKLTHVVAVSLGR